ncbi:MlaD family protein [Williamsia maris]|uniref:ABC-type transporter Mla maintaining outer membrane lipid asymmetry, component MlaD n=1 Tax=Williamsia maris TaxID=72806 RepID=A0ABT1H8P9_9NOCA|nr:MlaD family protein [Williamsia maris]MCP2174636.1 ABC-type transporter Mla maintaining outer membrane lipid asymmetry, component MlaD [Williamsia maris]
MAYHDPSGRGPSRVALLGLGAATVVVALVLAIPLTLYARGDFDTTVTVSAVADSVGDGLAAGGDVKYRGLIVGRVDGVTVADDGRQEITMSIDADQAAAIPDQVSAAYAPSNLLGVTGIELQAAGSTSGSGTPGDGLRDGEKITIGSDSTNVSVADLLRQVGEISTTITGDEFTRTIDIADKVVDAVQPLVRSGLDLLTLAASRQQMPLAEFFRILGPASRGVADLEGPFDSVLINLTRSTAEYTDPRVVTGVKDSLSGLIDTVGGLGGLVGDNYDGLATLLDFLTVTGSPLGQTLRSIPPAVTDARELLGRLEKSMPTQNGKVTLQVGVAIAQMPQLAPFLQSLAPPAPRAPRAGAPKAGGR